MIQPNQATKNVRKPREVKQSNIHADFASLSKLAKQSGAKIVITFE